MWHKNQRHKILVQDERGNISPKNSRYVDIQSYNSLISKILCIITKMLFNFNERKKQFY